MAYASEAATVKEFLKVAMSGQLKRGAKPVMWSPVEQTALAEAEIEYADRKASYDLGEVSDHLLAVCSSSDRG